MTSARATRVRVIWAGTFPMVVLTSACSGSKIADEESIAFWSSNAEFTSTVYVAKPDGSETRKVTRGWNVDSSPNGDRLVFVDGFDDDRSSVYVINEDGSERQRIVRNANYPAWSPDESQVAFLRVRKGVDSWVWDVYVLDMKTGRVRRLTNAGRYFWAPRGLPTGVGLPFRGQTA